MKIIKSILLKKNEVRSLIDVKPFKSSITHTVLYVFNVVNSTCQCHFIKMSAGQVRKSAVWDYFVREPACRSAGAAGPIEASKYATCIVCNARSKMVYGSTSGLIRHLEN